MKESAQAAMSFIRSRSREFGIDAQVFQEYDIHVHVPAGATPKDGPSAGVTMLTSILSALTKIPAYRNVAMTGELTLAGRVMSIGGLKEKVLAALRFGATTILIPYDNRKDLEEIPANIRKQLTIIPIKMADEVVGHTLTQKLKPLPQKSKRKAAAKKSSSAKAKTK